MLSRIAEFLYWIGRYVERAEAIARLTDVVFHHTLEMGVSPGAEQRRKQLWQALLSIVGDPRQFAERYGEANEATVPPYLTFDVTNPNAIVSCVARAREAARTMRHQIASETWEALNRFHLDLQRQGSGRAAVGIANAHDFYRSVTELSQLFQGVIDSTLPREEGWYFLQAGTNLERAEKTARALDIQYHLLLAEGQGAADAGGGWSRWLPVLHSLAAYEVYHKIYRAAVRPALVVELLVFSPVFPRSVRFAVGEVAGALEVIAAHGAVTGRARFAGEPAGFGAADGGEATRAVGRLLGLLTFARVDEVIAAGLRPYLIDLQRQCYAIGELIHGQYFALRPLRAEEVLA